MLGIRQGANTIGSTQIGGLYQSINGLHAGLTGQQIRFLSRLPYVAAIVPNDTVQMSSWGGSNSALYSNAQRWAWTVGARANWGSSWSQGNVADDRRRRLRRRRRARGDFGGRVLGQVNLTSLTPNSPGDGYGHGTFVAGIAAGAATGYAGVTPTANLFSRRRHERPGPGDRGRRHRRLRLDPPEQGAVQHPRRQLLAPRRRAAASLFFDPLDQAVEKLWLNGVVVVAAAGNYATDGQESGVPFAPGNDPFVITVGAADIGTTTSTLGRHRRTVVGLGLHAGRLLEARPLRSRPLHGRAGLGEQRARARAARITSSRPATCS